MIERLPALAFAALLFGLALLPTRARWPEALLLWSFMLGDWAWLAALPRAGKSFGPAKPPTLVLAVLRLAPAAFTLLFNAPAQIVGTGLVIYGFWIEPHHLGLTQQTLRSPKLDPARPSLRLLHLGDLHVERITDRERQLVELARSARPDVILFSGDFINLSYLRDPQAWEAARTVVREVAQAANPRLGFLAVSGSPAVDLEDVLPGLLDGLPVRWLRDESVSLDHHGQPVDIVGVSCSHKPFVDAPRLRSLLNGAPDRFTILLYHSPDLAPEAAQAGVDLQLSGHTHGGQVRLPLYGALFSGSLYGKSLEMGRQRVGGMTLYVTRGIGLEGKGAPRVRFLCPPEVTLWEISG